MITNTLGLPQPFVDAATSDYKPTEGRYSVTRVLGSPCEAVLLRRHGDELDGDVADMVCKCCNFLMDSCGVHELEYA